mmetsp:Transcript_23302/g.52568  ORF Transcript_23302/g.52568 Transcript_23302/m.52568 type:complete len:168 (-) Transcript_23302:787-1290(-)
MGYIEKRATDFHVCVCWRSRLECSAVARNYARGREPFPRTTHQPFNLLFASIASQAAFDEILESCSGVIVAIDGDDPISDGLLDVVMPDTTTAKRVVVMSRNLNGKGLGPFVQASKSAANKEVWAGGSALVAEYKRMEAKVKSLCERSGAEWVVVRAGTLKVRAKAA